MTWNVERKVTFGGVANDIAWDGRYLWASYDASVKLIPYEVMDRSDYDDIAISPGSFGPPVGTEYFNPITEEDIKTINRGGYWIAPYAHGAFVSTGKTFTNIKFISSLDSSSTYPYTPFDLLDANSYQIDTPQNYDDPLSMTPGARFVMTSNLLFCNGKLWMISNQRYADVLFTFDVITKTWTKSVVPNRPQSITRHISYDKNGHVLVPNFNDMNVLLYDVNNPTATPSVIAMDNKEPTFTTTDSDRNTFVASFNGMISVLDTNANTATHFSFNGSGGGASEGRYSTEFWGLESDTDYLWISTKGTAFNRMDLTTKELIGTEVGEPVVIPDLITSLDETYGEMILPVVSPTSMLIDNGDGTWSSKGTTVKSNMDENYTLNDVTSSYKQILCIPSMTKQIWNGGSLITKTYPKQVVVNGAALTVFPNDKFWRENMTEVNATAMISSGYFDYTGD